MAIRTVSYTHLRAHETPEHLVCRLLLEKKQIGDTQAQIGEHPAEVRARLIEYRRELRSFGCGLATGNIDAIAEGHELLGDAIMHLSGETFTFFECCML